MSWAYIRKIFADGLGKARRGKNNLIIFPDQGNPRGEELARLRKENADLREASD
jgi:hypothetical protein